MTFIIVPILFITCTSRRTETKILFYTPKANSPLEEQLQELAGKSGWSVEKVTDLHYLNEDFLKQFSSIFITFSSLSHLNHRATTTIKRYLEAGGGSVVAVKDTVHTQNEWPWLRTWNSKEVGQQLQQNNSNLNITL